MLAACPIRPCPFKDPLCRRRRARCGPCTFGNRSYDSPLTELNEELTAAGFRVFAAGAFARPHAFANIGHEHPTKEDNNLLETLLGVAEVKIGQEDFGSITIKDGAPCRSLLHSFGRRR